MQKINYQQLRALISKPGAQIVGLTTYTDARARKANNPIGEICKRVRLVAFVGAKYQDAVNREAERQNGEGGFVAGPLPKGGKWIIPNKIIERGGNLYLRTQSAPGQRTRQAAKVLGYFNSKGKRVAHKMIASFLPSPLGSAKQASVGVGESETPANQIMVRDYKFASLEKVRVGGKSYTVEHQ